jgi:hypothetical protein
MVRFSGRVTRVTACGDTRHIKDRERYIDYRRIGKNLRRVGHLGSKPAGNSMVMRQLRHNGNLWQRLFCLVGALLVFSSPLMASACPRGQCAPDQSKPAGQCHAMATDHNDVASFQANSPFSCCQLTQNPPATATSVTEKVEFQPVASNVVGKAISVNLPATKGLSDRFEVTFSPPDVHSFLCTLLV